MSQGVWVAISLLCLAGCGGSSTRAGQDAGNPSDAGTTSDAGTLPDGGAGCTTDGDCASGDYCAGTGCGSLGSCAALPASCPPEVAEVCGCDGNSYSNSCKAFSAGTRVYANGECPTQQCTALLSQIQGVVDAGQTCAANSDCLIDRTPCGVGPCWAALNQASDGQLGPLASQYTNDNCGASIVCDCTFLPSGAVCDGGFCSGK